MLYSLYKIDHIASSGGAVTTLLNYGDKLETEIAFPVAQGGAQYQPVGAAWGTARAQGGARRALDWTRRSEHASHAAAAGYCLSHPAGLPLAVPGKLRISVQGGAVWDFMNAVILGATSKQDTRSNGFSTLTSYHCDTGQSVHVSG